MLDFAWYVFAAGFIWCCEAGCLYFLLICCILCVLWIVAFDLGLLVGLIGCLLSVPGVGVTVGFWSAGLLGFVVFGFGVFGKLFCWVL